MSACLDVTLYIEALERELRGRALDRVRLVSPFPLHAVEPLLVAVDVRVLRGVSRRGKRLVFDLGDELYFVLRPMITGRLRQKPLGVAISKKCVLAAFDLAHRSLLLAEHDLGGLELFDAELAAFLDALGRKSHTLKRALTNPHMRSAIDNASNETNDCATCQTGGPLLADRSLSKLLKDDWPKTVEEWQS